MENLTTNEETIIEFMEDNNFSSLTQDNVGEYTSILEKVDPEVAKAIIERLPEAIRGMAEITKIYTDLLSKGIDSCSESTASCYASEDKIIDTLAVEVAKDIPFEQKQYYIEKMEDAAERKEAKDTEHRETVTKGWALTGTLIGGGILLLAGIFLGGGAGGGKLPPVKPL